MFSRFNTTALGFARRCPSVRREPRSRLPFGLSSWSMPAISGN